MLIANGELEAIFNRYYADDIRKANFKNRKIIEIKNPFFHDENLLNDKRLWFTPQKSLLTH
jgi:hypothetical protein